MKHHILERYGRFASNNPGTVVAVALVFTIVMAYSASFLSISTNFQESLPKDIEIVQRQDLINDAFPGSDSLILVVKLNTDQATEGDIADIRDPRVMKDLAELEELLRKNPDIETVSGAPDILIRTFGEVPDDTDQIKSLLAGAEGVVSPDYSVTLLFMEVNTGEDDEKIMRLEKQVREDIETVGFSGSVATALTGGPLIQTTIFELLTSDLLRTITVAGFFIFIVLVFAYRSPLKGLYTVLLLILAIIWTGGTMQAVGIPLSIITAMVGSMIIGIGIDYTIHIMNRYKEERDKKKQPDEAAGIAADRVGKAIIATSVTTMASFLSQGISGFPLLADLGIALSLGIFYAMVAAILVLPAIVAFDERAMAKLRGALA